MLGGSLKHLESILKIQIECKVLDQQALKLNWDNQKLTEIQWLKITMLVQIGHKNHLMFLFCLVFFT